MSRVCRDISCAVQPSGSIQHAAEVACEVEVLQCRLRTALVNKYSMIDTVRQPAEQCVRVNPALDEERGR